MVQSTDYGHPERVFFLLKYQTFGLGQINWTENFGLFWGVIITNFCTVTPLSMFSTIQPLFLQKIKPLYPHPKYLFEIGI